MLQWTGLHPYNAVHVVRIPEPFVLEHLRQVVSTTIESLALNEFLLNRSKKPSAFTQYAIRNTRSEIFLLPNPLPTTLYGQIQRELNTPFLCGPRVNPFRFFVQANGQSFFLGVTCFHPIPDAE